jgi:hypothetical protein
MEIFTYECLDCDYFSVKIKTESISKLGRFSRITQKAVTIVKEIHKSLVHAG